MSKNETLEHALESAANLTALLNKVSPLMDLATALTATAIDVASTGNFTLATKMLALSSEIMDVANIDLAPKH